MVGKTVCPHCFKSFSCYGNRRLQKHIKHAHDTFRPFVCKECGKSFRSNPLAKGHPHHKTHPNISVPDSTIKGTSTLCTECGKSYKSIKILKIHMLKFHPYLDIQQLFAKSLKEKPFICTECKASFTKNGSMKEHVKGIHKIDQTRKKQKALIQANVSDNQEKQTNLNLLAETVSDIKCEFTTTEIKMNKNYKEEEMSGKLNFRPEIEMKSNIKDNETPVIHSIESETKTNRKMKAEEILQTRYTKTELNESGIFFSDSDACKLCHKIFRHPSRMKLHMISHSGERPHICEACGKSFKEKIKLRTHMHSHDGKKLHTCEACGKSFSLRHTLNAHLKSHTVERPYKCTDCEKSFVFNDSRGLKGHMKIHISVKSHKCETCGFRCASVQNLKQHTIKHNIEKPYKCVQCDYSCKTKPYLKSHLRIHSQGWNRRQYNKLRPFDKGR